MRLFLAIIAIFAFINASASIGIVKDVNGRVKLKKHDSIKKIRVKVGTEIDYGDLVVTAKKATAVLHLKDGSNIVLAPNSSIYFGSYTSAEQKSGKIYYKMSSRDAKHALKIKTQFAIIGIKGTTFVINEEKNALVLKEGLIGVESIKGEFNLYRKKVLDEFKSYMAKEMQGFAKFEKDSGYEPPIKTKSFDLTAGKRVIFGADNRVNEDFLDTEDKKTFSIFESILKRHYRE
ncbi:hypothetical protein MNB_SM-3-550 [hydrothermal vent metagenome]|uniref:FecR protein domain-containing protein n=1 Tax=hydrothermal vent metagenome TaxID=652676 RepID=A0A1W1D203_9ZZZZ